MRGAWGIAAAWAIAACACACGGSKRSKVPTAPSSVPCGYRALTGETFALSVPIYWQQNQSSKRRLFPGERGVLEVQGAASALLVTTEAWDGDGKSFAKAFVARLKENGYEHVEHRWTSVGDSDALFVEHRVWDSGAKIQWHEWRVLTVARGLGWQLLCRVDEDDVRTLRPVCTQILETFVVQP